MEVNVLLRPKSTMPTCRDTDDQVVRYVRHERPSHFIFKIESFSVLRDALASTGKTNIESVEFTIGNYTWKLLIYPKGNTKYNGDDHISAYLNLKCSSTITATFRFFVYNQLECNFLTIEDLRVRRFDSVRNEWGISKLLPLSTFNDPSKGFLYDNCCMFGAEVFLLDSFVPKSATFNMLKGFQNCSHSWKKELPSIFSKEIYSPVFTFEGYSWRFYVQAKAHDRKEHLFLSLDLDSSGDLDCGRSLYSEFDFYLTDHFNGDKEWKENVKTWFSSSSSTWTMSLPVQSLIYETFGACRVTLEVNFKQVFEHC